MAELGYHVYRNLYRIALPDPDFNYTRFHNSIFVETEANGGGYVHQVVGDTVTGLAYEKRQEPSPDQSESLEKRIYLGQIRASAWPSAIDDLLQNLPAPPRQKRFSPLTMRYERCRPDGSWYAEHEQPPPLWKCTEWVEEKAIPALRRSGLLHSGGTFDAVLSSPSAASGVHGAGTCT